MKSDKLVKPDFIHDITKTTDTSDLLSDLRHIIDRGRQAAYGATDAISVATYWNIGRRIVLDEQGGHDRAEYGKHTLAKVAEELSREFGKTYSVRNLRHYRQFYQYFSDLEIWYTCVPNLSWSHFRHLLRVPDEKARLWYMKEAKECGWNVRTLERNITTQYYGRRSAAHREHLSLPAPDVEAKSDPMEYIKSPLVAEFLGFRRDSKYSESHLEQALIDNLEQFILELGRGFAFVERQQHVNADGEDFFIDLVFYNFRMKRFVIFELKTHRLTHADIGQLDMYVRMYDDTVRGEDDNPTVGVLLCADTNDVIAKYSVLNGSEQLFASKYMAYMPTEEELRREIEQQRQFFLSQHGADNE